jgi:hypothetical protein
VVENNRPMLFERKKDEIVREKGKFGKRKWKREGKILLMGPKKSFKKGKIKAESVLVLYSCVNIVFCGKDNNLIF